MFPVVNFKCSFSSSCFAHVKPNLKEEEKVIGEETEKESKE